MKEAVKITPKEYEEFKKLKRFELEISDNYETLFQQVLHMQLLIFAYFDNNAEHHSYNSDDMFNLIFNACEEMYASALKLQNIVQDY